MPDSRCEALRNAPLDSWVALSADGTKIVAAGGSYQDVATALDRIGDTDSVILKTPSSWLPTALLQAI